MRRNRVTSPLGTKRHSGRDHNRPLLHLHLLLLLLLQLLLLLRLQFVLLELHFHLLLLELRGMLLRLPIHLDRLLLLLQLPELALRLELHLPHLQLRCLSLVFLEFPPLPITHAINPLAKKLQCTRETQQQDTAGTHAHSMCGEVRALRGKRHTE